MVEFKKTATKNDFDIDSTVSCTAGKYTEIANMQVPAQQLRFWGNGGIINGVDDRGVLKMDLNTSAPALIPGTVRLVVADANKVVRNFVQEIRTEDLDSTVGTYTRLAKYSSVGAKEDSYLLVEFNPDSTATISKADSTISAPITIRTL